MPNKGGRPTSMTPETLDLLRQAFLFGATDEEACAFAKIGKSTLYDYQNAHPEFSEQKDQWKEDPILKAKKTVVDSLDDTKNAQWYLERKKKDEFSPRSEVTGKDGKELTPLLVKFISDEKDRDTSRV